MACGHCGVSRRAAGASAAAWAALNVMDWAIHDKILSSVYHSPKYASLWNPQAIMSKRMWALLLSHAVVVCVFTAIYSRGYEEGKCGKGQGLRFGVLAWALSGLPLGLHQYFIYPVSAKLAGAWLAAGLAEFLVVGLIVGAIYKPEAPHTH